MLQLVYKSLNGLGIEYIKGVDLNINAGGLVEPRIQSRYGEAAFTCYDARQWKKLPTEIKSAPGKNISGDI